MAEGMRDAVLASNILGKVVALEKGTFKIDDERIHILIGNPIKRPEMAWTMITTKSVTHENGEMKGKEAGIIGKKDRGSKRKDAFDIPERGNILNSIKAINLLSICESNDHFISKRIRLCFYSFLILFTFLFIATINKWMIIFALIGPIIPRLLFYLLSVRKTKTFLQCGSVWFSSRKRMNVANALDSMLRKPKSVPQQCFSNQKIARYAELTIKTAKYVIKKRQI